MIRSLLHVGLFVPELEPGKAFYELFGLEVRMDGDDLYFRCPGRDLDQVRLMKGPRKKFAYVALGTNAEGLGTLMQRLQAEGVAVSTTQFGLGKGIWFQDPHGDWVNVQICEPPESTLPAAAAINAPGRYQRVGLRACEPSSRAKKARPRRLGHLIRFSPDVAVSTDFYTRVCGMKISDQAGNILSFLRGSAGGDHHLMAFAKSSHSGLHHLSFEVSDFDEIEIGAQTMIKAGYKSAFGPGRHIGGSNYFHYIRDPWNSLAEYFWDIDIIPEDDSGWVPLNEPPENLIAVWAAAPPPPDFVQNFEERD